jgi:uncharacterized protein DUF4339
MDDDSRVIDKGWDALPEYGNQSGDADDAVTVSISTTPGEWLVNTVDAVVVPMSMVEVVEALQSHKLTERSLVWRAGMPEWATVDNVPQLKLAARRSPAKSSYGSIPPRASIAVTAASGTGPAAAPSKPPPKPVRATASSPANRSPTLPPQSIPSRRGTLPFGLPTPLTGQSRAGGALGSSPRAAAPPVGGKEEEVLAVYARPAATISFELSPPEPARKTAPVSSAPQTLAPMTTDSAQRRAPLPRHADLSVVAASDFRQVQRSSKRLVWLSSLASAAAASLLTFAISRGGSSRAPAAPEPAAPVAAAPAAAAPAASVAPSVATVTTPAAPSAEPAPPVAEAPAEVAPAKPKPKPSARRVRALSAAPAPRPAKPDPEPGAGTRDPSSEPNPYDVKLEEDPSAAKAEPAKPAHGSGLEPDGDAPQASSASPNSPGF